MTASWGYLLFPSALGTVAVVWTEDLATLVQRITLPAPTDVVTRRIGKEYPLARPASSPRVDDLAGQISRLLSGEPVSVGVDLLALDRCTPFQHRVLLAEHEIPRGWVSTYGRLAHHLGSPGAARAVGSALAHNPFPLVIPCHRAIQSNGSLGGFQGGVAMKRVLLEMEGVEFDAAGRVKMTRVRY